MRKLILNKMILKTSILFFIAFFAISATVFAEDVNYGSWDGSASYSGEVPIGKAYDSELDPFSEQGGEYSNFVCASQSGAILSDSDQEVISDILKAASNVYRGEFYIDGVKNIFSGSKKPPENGGYPAGRVGINQFLNNEKFLLENGKWIPYQNRQIVRSSSKEKDPSLIYPIPAPGWSGKLLESATPIPITKGNQISSVLNSDANHPLNAGEMLPEACALGVEEVVGPKINDLFSNPGKFQSDSFLYIPTSIATSLLEFFQPYAFRWTFWTPHSERSDLIWNTPSACAPTATNESQGFIAKGCQDSNKVGFSESSGSSTDQAWYLKVAHFVQWLVSGTYILILLLAAILFMVKGNRKTQLQLTTVIPRILAAMIITAFAGYLIGTMITFSNTIVQTVFNFSETRTIGVLSAVLLESGNIIGGNSTMSDIGQLIVSALSSVSFIFFVLVSLVRQVLLVMLIILFPLAAFTLVSSRWQDYFFTYLRALSVIIFLPVVLAFIFKVSLSINPLVLDPVGSYGNLQGLLGLILILITFWLMYRTVRFGFAFIKDGRGMAFETSTEKERERVVDVINPRQNKDNQPTMIPSGKQLLSLPKQVAAANVVATKPTAVRPNVSPGQGLTQAIQSKGSGSQRVSTGAAKAYKEKLRSAIGAATARKGAPLTEEEIKKIKNSFAKKNGGTLAEKDGSYYLNPTEEVVVRKHG